MGVISGAAAVAASEQLAGREPGGGDTDDTEDDDEIADPRAGMQQIIRSLDIDHPVAALTFDDGPHPRLTPRILDALDRGGVQATFMVMGHAGQQHPQLVREILAAGHEIGHHGWRHLNLAKVGALKTREEIEVGAQVVEDTAGIGVHLFRPARGRLSEGALRLLARLRHDVILWSVTRGEKRWQSPSLVAQHVVQQAGPGAIIDLHDGIGRGTFVPGTALADELLSRRLVEVDALPQLVEGCGERGIRLGTVSDLLGWQTRLGRAG